MKRVNISELIEFHKKKRKLATLTAFQPAGRFGLLDLEEDIVMKINEKVLGDGYWYNGGYYVLEPEIFRYIKDDSSVWEHESLVKLSEEKQIAAYKYRENYQPMDTLKDKRKLEEMWDLGKAYWKTW